jgi:hypothetical protein
MQGAENSPMACLGAPPEQQNEHIEQPHTDGGNRCRYIGPGRCSQHLLDARQLLSALDDAMADQEFFRPRAGIGEAAVDGAGLLSPHCAIGRHWDYSCDHAPLPKPAKAPDYGSFSTKTIVYLGAAYSLGLNIV